MYVGMSVCPNQNPFISSDTVASSHCLFHPLYPCSPFFFFFAPQYFWRRCLPSQWLRFIIHPFHPSSSIAFNISLFTSLSFWQCLINMLAAGSQKKKKKNGDKHQTHAFFFVWGCVCCKRWVTLEKAKLARSPPTPHLFSGGLARGVIRPRQNWPLSSSQLHMRGCINACVCVPGLVCACLCVPVFPPCGQVTIANQACKSRLKRPREEERREGGK